MKELYFVSISALFWYLVSLLCEQSWIIMFYCLLLVSSKWT